MTPYQKVFPNGLRLVVYPMAETRAVSMGLFLRAGSLYDPPDQVGLSHALEHMVFHGTATRTREDIGTVFEADGGDLNAMTTPDYVGFVGEILDERWQEGLDALLDMVRHPRLDDEDWRVERQAILAEIQTDLESPMTLCALAARRIALGPDHPGVGRVGGHPEVIEGVTIQNLQAHHARFFVPGNVVLSIAGNVDLTTVLLQVERLTQDWTGQAPSLVLPEHRYAGGNTYLPFPGLQTAGIQVIFPAPQVEFRKALHMGVLSEILVGHSDAVLFRELRFRRGLVYDISGAYSQSRMGLYTLQCVTPAEHHAETLDTLLHIVYDVAAWVTPVNVQAAIRRIKGALLMVETLPAPRMIRHGISWMLTGTARTPEMVVDDLLRLKADELREVALHYLKAAWTSVAVVGPERS